MPSSRAFIAVVPSTTAPAASVGPSPPSVPAEQGDSRIRDLRAGAGSSSSRRPFPCRGPLPSFRHRTSSASHPVSPVRVPAPPGRASGPRRASPGLSGDEVRTCFGFFPGGGKCLGYPADDYALRPLEAVFSAPRFPALSAVPRSEFPDPLRAPPSAVLLDHAEASAKVVLSGRSVPKAITSSRSPDVERPVSPQAGNAAVRAFLL
jgi:hypothetical protein